MKFLFVSPTNQFHCGLQCDQCAALTRAGSRCKRRVCVGLPYCFMHLPIYLNLKILESKLPNAGKGLFAYDPTKHENEVVFRSGDVIADYDGEELTRQALDERYGQYTAPYAVSYVNNRFFDAACKRGIASMANAPRSNQSANAKLINGRNMVRIKATKPIRNNQEILISYGREYRFTEPTSHKTK